MAHLHSPRLRLPSKLVNSDLKRSSRLIPTCHRSPWVSRCNSPQITTIIAQASSHISIRSSSRIASNTNSTSSTRVAGRTISSLTMECSISRGALRSRISNRCKACPCLCLCQTSRLKGHLLDLTRSLLSTRAPLLSQRSSDERRWWRKK